jgi:hypothetical protein
MKLAPIEKNTSSGIDIFVPLPATGIPLQILTEIVGAKIL